MVQKSHSEKMLFERGHKIGTMQISGGMSIPGGSNWSMVGAVGRAPAGGAE